MNTFRSAAIQILKKSEQPLHYKDITKFALEEGLIETEGATPEASMNAQITVDIKSFGTKSAFIRSKPGVFSINPSFNEKEENAVVAILEKEEKMMKEEIGKITIETGYTGKAGEHLVCSELLFRGFNASIMSVDVGMDIVAMKENHLYTIQVKTANLNKFDTYVFDVRKVSFERHSSGNVFYVFVLRADKKSDFVIVPFHEMEKSVHQWAILEINGGSRYRVTFKFRKGKIYLGKMDFPMDYYLNNWETIK